MVLPSHLRPSIAHSSLLANLRSQSPFILPLATPVPSSNNTKDATLVTALPLPAGTTIYLSIQGVNRDPNIWGPDADEFRPERWLEGDKKSREWDGKGREKAKREVPSLWSSMCVSFIWHSNSGSLGD